MGKTAGCECIISAIVKVIIMRTKVVGDFSKDLDLIDTTERIVELVYRW